MTSLFSVLQAVTSANTFARINCIGTEKWRWWIYLRGAKHGENDEIVVDASAILHPADTLSLEPARIYWTFPVKSEKNISIYSVFICVFLEKKNRRNSLQNELWSKMDVIIMINSCIKKFMSVLIFPKKNQLIQIIYLAGYTIQINFVLQGLAKSKLT